MLPGLSAAAMLAGGGRPPSFRNLGSLFSGGADGIMFDLSDKSLMFQDANGAAPVVSNGDPIGFVYDQHKWGGKTLADYRASQPELMVNGTFDSGLTSWSSSTMGYFSVVSGALRISPDGPIVRNIYQGCPTISGRWYEVSLEYIAASGSVGRVSVGSSSSYLVDILPSQALSSFGIKRFVFRAVGATSYISVAAGTAGTADFDNVSVKEIDGHHATQATAANRPLWQSATNDVLFDGSNDSLITDFYFQSNNNFLAAWQHLAIAVGTFTVFGALDTSPSAFATLVGAGGKANSAIGAAGGPASGVTDIYNRAATMSVTQTAALATLYVDGLSEATKGTPGDLPDIADGVPVAIGARNQNGAINSFWNGRIKRVAAGQVDLTGIMSPAELHENLIAA